MEEGALLGRPLCAWWSGGLGGLGGLAFGLWPLDFGTLTVGKVRVSALGSACQSVGCLAGWLEKGWQLLVLL